VRKMPEPTRPVQINTAAEQKTTAYYEKMAGLFTERNKYAVGSPERQAAAEAIPALWAADG